MAVSALKPIELRPMVISPPFRGVETLPITVRPPIPRPSPKHVLQTSYHFTLRSGVSVSIASNAFGDELNVVVTMNEGEYQAAGPLAPNNVNVHWDGPQGLLAGLGDSTKSTLQAVMGIGGILDPGRVAVVYANGFSTDQYDLAPPDRRHELDNAVLYAMITHNGSVEKDRNGHPGYIVGDQQLYPIFGWVSLEWVDPTEFAPAVDPNMVLTLAARKRATARAKSA